MTIEQLQSKKYIIDYLTDEEREDLIIKNATNNLRKLSNSSYHTCDSAKDIGRLFDTIRDVNDDVIIHFLSHGTKFGIAKSNEKSYLQVIHWELLLKEFEKINYHSKSLSINLMAVCYSNRIVNFDNKPYNYIWTANGITNSIAITQLIYTSESFMSIVANLDGPQMFSENVGANKNFH